MTSYNYLIEYDTFILLYKYGTHRCYVLAKYLVQKPASDLTTSHKIV